ncbi:2-dehydropantoate 2-reductase N-terminal domain-containing protein [Actinoplanes sp. NPDC051470]|uniref:ketopantoate reductase family protein n=1 Tax=unclassified Actinoplanes TaxID=2626549 RepID=UPI00342C1024
MRYLTLTSGTYLHILLLEIISILIGRLKATERKSVVMKLLVYGVGATGSVFAARLHEAGHDVSVLDRGERQVALRRYGVQLAEGTSPAVRRVAVPVVEHPAGGYDLIAVFVRTHQVSAVLESLAGTKGDVLFTGNWAAGAQPLGAVIGYERVLLGFPGFGSAMDGDVARYSPENFMVRRVRTPVGEPDGRSTPRLERIVRAFRTARINAKVEPQMDSWLKTHATFAVPLGQAVNAAGGPAALADDPGAVRAMIRSMRQALAALPTRPVPRGFVALQTLPQGLLAAMLRRFLLNPTVAYTSLGSTSLAETAAEYKLMTEQMHAYARVR